MTPPDLTLEELDNLHRAYELLVNAKMHDLQIRKFGQMMVSVGPSLIAMARRSAVADILEPIAKLVEPSKVEWLRELVRKCGIDTRAKRLLELAEHEGTKP